MIRGLHDLLCQFTEGGLNVSFGLGSSVITEVEVKEKAWRGLFGWVMGRADVTAWENGPYLSFN